VTLFVISGVSAAGKSTVARLLAERFERGVCVPGDAIRAMIVSGRVEVRPDSGEEALRQLTLRYAGALSVADVFLNGGFDVVVEDVIIGPILRQFLALVPVPEFHLVFLDPDAAAIERRERERDRVAYGPDRWSVGGLQAVLREETDRIGLWLDTTGQSAEQTVEAILSDLDASRVVTYRLSLPVSVGHGRSAKGIYGSQRHCRPRRTGCEGSVTGKRLRLVINI
jgi:predicted kinase